MCGGCCGVGGGHLSGYVGEEVRADIVSHEYELHR